MRVIYVPLILPINIRNIVALCMCFVALLLLVLGVSLGNWIEVDYKNTSPSTADGTLLSVSIHQGLQYVSFKGCFYDTQLSRGICETSETRYSYCTENDHDTSNDLWCVGKSSFVASFAFLVVGLVGGFLALVLVFLREEWFGPFLFLVSICTGVGLVLFRVADGDVEERGHAYLIDAIARIDNGKMSIEMGMSFPLATAGAFLQAVASIIACSIFICKPNATTERDPRPEIEVVRMNAGTGVRMASHAPRPGFVALGTGDRNGAPFTISNRIEDETDSDDLDLITVQTVNSNSSPHNAHNGGGVRRTATNNNDGDAIIELEDLPPTATPPPPPPRQVKESTSRVTVVTKPTTTAAAAVVSGVSSPLATDLASPVSTAEATGGDSIASPDPSAP